jgi:predicted RNA-binding Zn-ribbon protein involved in translation (DUF1610 family)
MKETSLAKSVDIKIVDSTSQIIINGVVQKARSYVMCCPNCGKQLLEFPAGANYGDVIEYLNKNSSDLKKAISYCPACSQNLSYEKEVIDVDVK